jgi:hypothetical protein
MLREQENAEGDRERNKSKREWITPIDHNVLNRNWRQQKHSLFRQEDLMGRGSTLYTTLGHCPIAAPIMVSTTLFRSLTIA